MESNSRPMRCPHCEKAAAGLVTTAKGKLCGECYQELYIAVAAKQNGAIVIRAGESHA